MELAPVQTGCRPDSAEGVGGPGCFCFMAADVREFPRKVFVQDLWHD